jgi:hypothetical protein
MMKTLYLMMDSWFPYFFDIGEDLGGSEVAIEITEEEAEWVGKILEEASAVQEFLRQKYDEKRSQ